MSVYDVPNTNPKRRPSLRGGVVLDVVRGTERVRAWPGKRTKAQNEEQKARNDHFRSVQWATKYLAPEMMIDIMEAREGMPLLPRDVATMLLYNTLAWVMLPSGKRLYPEMARNQVSESLDTISQSEGYILIRGPDFWSAVPYVPPVNPMLLFDEQILTAAAASVIISGIPANAQDIFITIEARSSSTNSVVRMRLNNDTGANYNFRRTNLYGSATGYPTAYAEVSEMTKSTANANLFCYSEVTIPSYARTDRWKRIAANLSTENDGTVGVLIPEQVAATWKSAAAVNRIDLYPDANNFAAGSIFRTWLRGSA